MILNHCEIGDCRDIMRRWIAEGVKMQTCVTSPPYWGLRDYQNKSQIWGGRPHCEHYFSDETLTVLVGKGGNWQQAENGPGLISGRPQTRFRGDAAAARKSETIVVHMGFCECGAWRGSLGLEPTPELYVDHIVEVFRLVRELLADDGTLWLNLGDSYNAGRDGGHPGGKAQWKPEQGKYANRSGANAPGLKPKDLVGIPWRVAFALQADGWYLRQDIIWSKPNPMPESVRDRCTKSHEYLFLLAKNQRYYFDADAIAEPASPAMMKEIEDGYEGKATKDYAGARAQDPSATKARIIASAKQRQLDPQASSRRMNENMSRARADGGHHDSPFGMTRNKRSVWTVATQPYAEAHFATFPSALIEPCVLAGSRSGDTVLDPFMGSGTTAEVAQQLGRRWLACELNPAYRHLQNERTRQAGMIL